MPRLAPRHRIRSRAKRHLTDYRESVLQPPGYFALQKPDNYFPSAVAIRSRGALLQCKRVLGAGSTKGVSSRRRLFCLSPEELPASALALQQKMYLLAH